MTYLYVLYVYSDIQLLMANEKMFLTNSTRLINGKNPKTLREIF